MAKNSFQAIPTELLEHAEALRSHLDTRGYRIKIECNELGFPKTPTIVGKLGHKTVIYEVCSKIDIKNINSWLAFCKSCSADTQYALCIPESSSKTYLPKHQNELQLNGIGVYVSNSQGIREFFAPRDLSLKLALPDISTLPRKIRSLLGHAYELFDKGEWRQGFFEACKALEAKAENYLNNEIEAGRLKVYEKGKVITLSPKQIKKMTLGQLKDTFSKVQPQNATDSLIYKTLQAINPDRIPQAHKVATTKQEAKLRQNVGTNMHAIVQALKVLC